MSVGLTGDIFTLSADGQYEGQWQGINVLRANAAVDVGVALTAEANFCHGVEVALGARASAEAQAALSVFLSAGIEGQAFAQAGAQVRASLAPDLFGRFGLIVDAGAFAEAAVAGRLRIGLNIAQIKELAEALLGDDIPFVPNQMALDIFGYFLDELEIGAGVWGRAAFSAMARGHLEVYGSLADPQKAGFVIEGGGSIGLKGGTGWDFFAVAQLKDVHRFYARTADRITAEVVKAAWQQLDPAYRPVIQLLDLCLPAVLQIALVAGQTTATSLIANSDKVVEPTVRAVLEQMRRFILRKFVEIAEKMLIELVEGMIDLALSDQLSEAQREELREKTQALIDRLTNVEQWSLETITPIAADLTDIGVLLFAGEEALWRQPLTIAWCGLAAVHAINEAHSAFSAGAAVNVFGFGASLDLREDDFDLPQAPSVILDEFEAFLGGRPQTIRFSDAVDYIASTSIGPLCDVYLPELSLLMAMAEEKLDVTPGDFVSAFLLGTVGGDLSSTALYIKLRDLLRTAIEGEIDAHLLPALKAGLGDNADARLYLQEVVEPSLAGGANFIFAQLDKLVAGNLAAVAFDSFRVGLSTLVYKVVARNVIVLGSILHDHVLNALVDNLALLRDEVESNPHHVMVDAAIAISTILTNRAVSPSTLRQATHRLVIQLVRAGQSAFGPGIWTAERRTMLRRLTLEALAVDDSLVDYHASADAILQAMSILASCNHKPNEQALLDLSGLMADVTLDQLVLVLNLVAPALAEFYLVITSEVVAEIDRLAREFIDAIAGLIDEALRQMSYWAGEAARLWAEAEAQALLVADQIDRIENQLLSGSGRQKILDDLYTFGIGQVVTQTISNTPGWDLLNEDQQAAALAVALIPFQASFAVARPFLDEALKTLGALAGSLETVIRSATAVDDAATAIGSALKQQVIDAVNEQIDDFGLVLPQVMDVQDVANAAKNALITDEVAAWARAAWQALARENDLRGEAADAARQQAEAQTKRDTEAARRAALLGGDVAVQILSPVSYSGATSTSFVYGPQVPIKLDILGANPAFVESGPARRVFFALNGRTLQFQRASWTETTHGMRLVADLDIGRSPLQGGLNILECSVADGLGNLVRQEAGFLVNPAAPLLNVVQLLPQESVFDVRDADDHARTEGEYVTFQNQGQAPIDLDRWLLMDKVGHTFEFPPLMLDPGAKICVVTGSGQDTNQVLHWGRRQAVWNNRGDIVYLLGPDRVLRSIYEYGLV